MNTLWNDIQFYTHVHYRPIQEAEVKVSEIEIQFRSASRESVMPGDRKTAS